jgi:hypothetical protein
MNVLSKLKEYYQDNVYSCHYNEIFFNHVSYKCMILCRIPSHGKFNAKRRRKANPIVLKGME